MTIVGSYTFSARAEEVWDALIDPKALVRILPGLQMVEIKPDGEITASAVVGLGPLRGRFDANLSLIEQSRPVHARIVGEARSGPSVAKGDCVIDAVERDGATVINYRAEAHIAGVPSGVGERLMGAAMQMVMRRIALRLSGVDGAELTNLDRAAQAWDEIDIDKVRQVAWSSIEVVSQAYARAFSGDTPSDILIHRRLAERLPGAWTSLKGAALVCGDMVAERAFFEPDSIVKFTEVDGFDISAVSLSKYQPEALRFNPHVVDCNDLVLERGKYDLVVACHGAHHVYNLGNFFYQANKSLKPNGLFYMVEWIGPEYLQIPRANHIVATLLLLTLFNRKTRITHMGRVKGLRVQEPPESFEPSEACNSTELIPQFLKYFKPIRIVYHAGLSYPIFEGIAQNIDQARPANRSKIKLVYFLEKWLTRLRIVKPLFAIAVAAKRSDVF